MIIIKAMGGLGNQLQQYALYEKMVSLGKEVAFDTSWFEDTALQNSMLAPRKLELSYFPGLSYRKASAEDIAKVYGKDDIWGKLIRKAVPGANHRFYESEMYHSEVFEKDTAYLEGYWAAEKYYADILPLLREKLYFPAPNEENSKLAAQIKAAPYSVSMHVRRGDYLDPANKAMFGDICTPAYYDAGIARIKKEYPDALFFVFSDDPAYVREHYASPEFVSVDINHGEDSFFDIYLMSLCDANICANSTFSFWGARLNPSPRKIMIRPSIHKNSQVFVPEQMHDLWKNWLLIDPQGNLV